MRLRSGTIARRVALRGATLLGLCLALGGPAAARDRAELACPTAGFSDGDRHVLDEAAARSEFEESGPSGIIERAVRACSDRYGWNDVARGTATVYTRAAIAQALFRQRLAGVRGLDLAALEEEVRSDRALIGAAADMRNRPPELDAFLLRMWPRVEPLLGRTGDDRAMIVALGGFFASTAVVEGMRVRFSRP